MRGSGSFRLATGENHHGLLKFMGLHVVGEDPRTAQVDLEEKEADKRAKWGGEQAGAVVTVCPSSREI